MTATHTQSAGRTVPQTFGFFLALSPLVLGPYLSGAIYREIEQFKKWSLTIRSFPDSLAVYDFGQTNIRKTPYGAAAIAMPDYVRMNWGGGPWSPGSGEQGGSGALLTAHPISRAHGWMSECHGCSYTITKELLTFPFYPIRYIMLSPQVASGALREVMRCISYDCC